jgi:mycothiol synthase
VATSPDNKRTGRMTNLPIHSYTVSDRPALVDFVASQSDWGVAGSQLGRDTFEQVLDQPSLEPELNCFVLEKSGVVEGFSLVFPEVPVGRAVIEVVAAAGTSAEQLLLDSAVERAKELHVDVAHVCIMEGSQRQQILEAYGFARVQTYFEMVWDHETLPDVQLPPGFWVRNFQDGDAALLTKVQNDAFTGSWGFCPNTVEQIESRARMPNTSQAGIVFLYEGDTPAGYCWTVLNPVHGKIRGIIGMVGVVPEYRGKGVSRSILYAGMSHLRTLNIADIGLEVDGSNAPAVGLYTSTGFGKVGERYWFELGLAGTPTPER